MLREDEIVEITRLLKAHQEQLQLIEGKLSEISARLIDN